MTDYYQPANTTGTDMGDVDKQEPTVQPPAEPVSEPTPPPAEPAVETPEPPKEEDKETPAPADDAGGQTQSYDALVDQLIKQLGFENVPEPQRADLVDAIKERIETRVLRVLMTSLTEEQTKQLEEKVKAENLDEKAIIEFISREAPNASQMIVSALDDLYMEMKEEVDTLTRAAGAATADKQQ